MFRRIPGEHLSKTAQAVGDYELVIGNLAEGGNLDEVLDYAGRALASCPHQLKPISGGAGRGSLQAPGVEAGDPSAER